LEDEIVLFDPFPKQEEFLEAVFSNKYSFVLYGGAIRGGKTFALLGLFLILSKLYPGSRWAIVRKDLQVIKKNLFPSWDKIKPIEFIKSHNHDTQTVTFTNGSQLIFFPEGYEDDKDLNRWKGLEVNGIGFEEINECQQVSFFKAFERVGSYIIPNCTKQPKPIIVGTCNPTQGWIKDLMYEPWKAGTLKKQWHYIPSKIYDNLPLLRDQPEYLPNLVNNLNRYEFEVFVEGNWDVQLKTGNEFLRSFDPSIHCKPLQFNSEKTVHISIDSNVFPHIAISCFQLIEDGNWKIRLIDELHATDPENTASQAGKKIVRWLYSIGYSQSVFLYGDRSTKNRNNIDDDKRSFFQIIDETIKNSGFRTVDKMLSYAPPVASIGDFVNAIFAKELDFAEIEINEKCKIAINDYIETKTDKDGTILKKRITDPISKVSYEPNGHTVDNLKDFIVQAFYDEYQKYMSRHMRLEPGGISYIKRTPKVTL
jgi:hypothetical protein